MAVNTLLFQQPFQSDTLRRPSESIWADCPVATLEDRTTAGVFMRDHFSAFNKTPATTEGNWGAELSYAQFSSTGGTITAGTGTGGEAVFASDGDDEGASIRTLATPFRISRSNLGFWFEARVKFSTVADTKNGVFLGLMQDVALTATVPLTAAGALADTNLVGFLRAEGDGDQIDTVYKADGVTAVTVQADALTTALTADTYIKLGMTYRPTTDPFSYGSASGTDDGYGKYKLAFYANGVLLTTYKQIPTASGTDFPNDVSLGLVLAILNATGTAPGSVTIDWWQAAQLFAS